MTHSGSESKDHPFMADFAREIPNPADPSMGDRKRNFWLDRAKAARGYDDTFATILDNLVDKLLQDSAMANKFLAALDAVRKAGIDKMNAIVKEDLETLNDKLTGDNAGFKIDDLTKPVIYHTDNHAVQVAYDVQKQALSEIDQKSYGADNKELLKDLIKAGLASAAGAWHDVVQKYGPPRNEVESAQAFHAAMSAALAPLKLGIEGNRLNDWLDYVGQELIIFPTLLTAEGSGKAFNLKTPTERLSDSTATTQPPLAHYAEIIATADTKSPRFEHLAGQLHLTVDLGLKFPDDFARLNALLSPTTTEDDITAKNSERFLQLFGQNIRMWLETAGKSILSDSAASKPVTENAQRYKELTTTLQELREFKSESDKPSAAVCAGLLQKYLKSGLNGDLFFAGAMQDLTVWGEHQSNLNALNTLDFTKSENQTLARALLYSVANERGAATNIRGYVEQPIISETYAHKMLRTEQPEETKQPAEDSPKTTLHMRATGLTPLDVTGLNTEGFFSHSHSTGSPKSPQSPSSAKKRARETESNPVPAVPKSPKHGGDS